MEREMGSEWSKSTDFLKGGWKAFEYSNLLRELCLSPSCWIYSGNLHVIFCINRPNSELLLCCYMLKLSTALGWIKCHQSCYFLVALNGSFHTAQAWKLKIFCPYIWNSAFVRAAIWRDGAASAALNKWPNTELAWGFSAVLTRLSCLNTI